MEKSTWNLQGDYGPPSRQVSILNHTRSEWISEHTTLDTTTVTPAGSESAQAEEQSQGKRRGHQSRAKAKMNATHSP